MCGFRSEKQSTNLMRHLPRPKRSVETRMRLLNSLKVLKRAMRSSCFMPEWMQMLGKLHSVSSRFSSLARATFETKITTWREKDRKTKVGFNFGVQQVSVRLVCLIYLLVRTYCYRMEHNMGAMRNAAPL